VDGTVIEVGQSGNSQLQRDLWNNKHQIYAYAFFIVVAPNGRIVYCSRVYEGNKHDKTAWDESTAVEELKKKYQQIPPGLQLAMGGDKAYPYMKVPDGWQKVITKSGEVPGLQQQAGLVFNPAIAKYRAVVERTIGRLKEWQVLGRKYYIGMDMGRIERIIFIICNIVNKEFFGDL